MYNVFTPEFTQTFVVKVRNFHRNLVWTLPGFPKFSRQSLFSCRGMNVNRVAYLKLWLFCATIVVELILTMRHVVCWASGLLCGLHACLKFSHALFEARVGFIHFRL
jgi:hypothetical protein